VYNITLKAFSNCDTVIFVGTIRVKRKAVAQFEVIPKNTCLPLTVTFNNQSTGINTKYSIQFGDGKDSVIQNNNSFNYTYYGNKTQLFQPLLIATNSCGTDTAFATVQAIANQLILNSNIRDTAVCGIPFTYSVNDNSAGASSYEWNWGDGTSSINNKASNQQHVYTQAGIYKVSHQVKNICGDTSVNKLIQLYPAVKANTGSIPTNLCIGDSIHFKSFDDSLAKYQWLINDSIYSNLPSFSIPFSLAGTYNAQLKIVKINPGKTCSDSSTAQFSIVKTKAGKAKINPLNGNCIPFNVQLINQTKPSSTTTWDMGDGNFIKGDTAEYIYLQPGKFNIQMIAKNEGGCEFIDSASISIKSPTGSIGYKSGLYCNSNNVVQFNPSVINTDSIEYNFGDGTIIISNTNPIQHQYKKPGIYFPLFTLISKNGCRVPLTKNDSIVIEKVKAGFTVKTIYNCGITTFNFQDSSESASGINQYQWKLNRNLFANGKTTNIDFKQTGTQETNLFITSNWGCTDSISGAYNVSIYSFPQVNINSINEACLNNLMELKSQISSIDSIIYRIWNLGNGSKANDSTVRILYYDEGKYTVKLTAATINKCYDSALKQITIHPVPTIKIASTNNVCNGDSLILKADGATNYVWKDQQENIICNNCLTLKVRPQRSTAYKVIGYNEFGCTQIASTNVQVIEKTKLTVSPESVICEGSSIRISASGGNSYQWLPANGLTNYNSQSPIVNPQTTTTYKVTAKDAYNCFTDTASIKVIVGKPTPIKIGKDSTMVAGSTIKLKAAALQNNIIRWRWSGGADLSCIACPDPVAKIINDETIICTATNSFGCISSDTIRFKTFCPNTEVFIPNAFTPDGDGVNDQFFVQSRGISKVKSMRIYSRWGEMVFEKFNFMPNDKTAGWNGSIRGVLANPDVYVYICEVVCEKGAIQLLKGNVAIIK
jgi:gliding motility-associated-like protein